jgi:ATP-dependent RNA helicase RhlE
VETFKELNLKTEILKAVEEAGYNKPMRIQAEAIPVALEGKDIIGCAQTGTGKTAAFTLPILNSLTKGKGPQVLILAPTRELAIQIGDSVEQYGKYLPFVSTTVYGGVRFPSQITALRTGVDILIATPGRLLDHIGRGNVTLKHVKVLVLDEADRMLDMGFLPDVTRIINKMPDRQQTMLFSATMPSEVRRISDRYMKGTVEINASPPATLAAGLTHRVYSVPSGLKNQLLVSLLKDEPVDSALIFTRTRRGADQLGQYLSRKKFSVTRLHSDLAQDQRQRALSGFRQGRHKILVATDIAARGLDIPTVSHVFNYDLPDNPEDYVHRAGRTARAEGTGFAFCLVAPEDIDLYNILEEHIGKDMFNWTSHPGFDYLDEPESTGKVRINRGRDRSRPGGGTSARVKRILGRPIDAKEDESTPASAEPPPSKPAFGRRRNRSPRRAGR